VDDLKLGVDMADATGVDAAAAGWSHNIPSIRGFTKGRWAASLATVSQLAGLIVRWRSHLVG